ncbi:MAG TPA: hypothetical protein DIV86_03455, partial [Alphaproteobacteria bacterium]|nr:hypothetical protein [Alphaproteobacteria bacterium]
MAEEKNKTQNGGVIVAFIGLMITAITAMLQEPEWVVVGICLVTVCTVISAYIAASTSGKLDNTLTVLLTVFLVVVIVIQFNRNVGAGAILKLTGENQELVQKNEALEKKLKAYEGYIISAENLCTKCPPFSNFLKSSEALNETFEEE